MMNVEMTETDVNELIKNNNNNNNVAVRPPALQSIRRIKLKIIWYSDPHQVVIESEKVIERNGVEPTSVFVLVSWWL